MATLYVKTVASGANDGSSESDAWQTWNDVVWGAGAGEVGPGDTLKVVNDGTHRPVTLDTVGSDKAVVAPTVSGTGVSRVIIEELSGAPKITSLALETSWTGPDGNGEYVSPATYSGTRYNLMLDGVRAVGQYSTSHNGLTGMPAAGSLGEEEWAFVTNKFYFKPAAGNTPGDYTIEVGANSSDVNVIDMSNRDYITVSGLEIYGAIRGSCIKMDTCTDPAVTDCIVHSGHQGTHVNNGSGATFTDNIAYDFDRRGMGDRGYDPTTSTTGQTYTGNTIYNIGNLSTDRYDQEGLMVGPGSSATVEKNYVYDIGTNGLTDAGDALGFLQSSGIAFDDSDCTCRYNYLKNIGGEGLHLGCKHSDYRTQDVYSNIIYEAGMNQKAGRCPITIRALPDPTYGAKDTAGHGHMFVHNNTILSGKASGQSTDAAIFIQAKGNVTAGGAQSNAILNVHLWNNITDSVDGNWELYVLETSVAGVTSKVNLVECHHNNWNPLSSGTSSGIKFNLLQDMGTQAGRVIDISSPEPAWAAADIVGSVAGKFTYDSNYEDTLPTSLQGDPVLIEGDRAALVAKSVNATSESLGYLEGTIRYTNSSGVSATTAISDYTEYAFNTSTPTIGAMEVTTGTVKSTATGIYLPGFDTIAVWTA